MSVSPSYHCNHRRLSGSTGVCAVAEVLPLSEPELRLLESLLRHKIRFMVVGLSAAALQGAPVVTEDVDLWFDNLSDPKLMQALVKVGAAYIPPFGYNPPMLGGAGSEPFDIALRMNGLDDLPPSGNARLKSKLAGSNSKCCRSTAFWPANRRQTGRRISASFPCSKTPSARWK